MGIVDDANEGSEAPLLRVSRFALVVTALLAVAYAYLASRLVAT